MPEHDAPNPKRTDPVRDWRQEAARIATVTRIGLIGLYRSQLPRMAAALAFRTIFSIIPVMAIGLLIFGSFVSEAQVEAGVRRVLDFAGVSRISAVEASIESDNVQGGTASDAASDPGSDPGSDLGADLGGGVDPGQGSDGDAGSASGPDAEPVSSRPTDAVPESGVSSVDRTGPGAGGPGGRPPGDPFRGADLEQVITNLINRVNTSIRNVPTGWIALTSGLVLFYAAMSMLIEIEKSFNQLCGAPSGRPWLRRIMLYWTILTAGSIMLAATFLAGDAFTRLVISIAGQDSVVGAVTAGYGVSVLISTVLLLGAYLTIPNTRIQFRSALAGAFFAAVTWELGKLGFTGYLRYTTTYAKFYGSIAVLPLFLLWVYLTWLIVLFGMQATYALQHFHRLIESKLSPTGEDRSRLTLLDPLVALSVARTIHQAFARGDAISADLVAERTGLRPDQANEVLMALHRGGFIHRVEHADGEDVWAPARPADRTPLDELLRCAQKLDAFRQSGADDALPSTILDAAIGSCTGKTLADLMPEADRPAPSAPE